MLRKLIGWAVAQGFVWTGARARALRQYDMPGSFLALVGHDPKNEVLERLLGWLIQHGFSFVSGDELIAMREGTMPWRKRIVWLSFDDGWKSFGERLLPILEKYGAKVTVFIAPHETARGQLWTNSIMSVTPYEEIRTMYLLPLEERLKKVDAILARIGNPRCLMDEAELRKLSKHPLVTLENHTYTHLSCSHRPVKEVLDEVHKTQAILTNWTGRVPKMVCYPFGHCNRATDEAIKAMGLLPIRLDAGVSNVNNIGACRNLFCDDKSNAENVCRALNAWVKVTVPDRE